MWDGILSFVEANESDQDDATAGENIKWEGTWVGVESADATKVDTPKRGAFDEFVTSENKFEVIGRAVKDEKDGASSKEDTKTIGEDASLLYKVSLVNGTGYDLEESKHKDTVHDMYLSTLRWKGNLRDQAENIVFALGENEFGNFVSVGWLRVGNRVTLARRYIDEDDHRCKWDINDLRKAIFDQIATTSEDGTSSLSIPPWKCAAMHVKSTQTSKRQKTQKQ